MQGVKQMRVIFLLKGRVFLFLRCSFRKLQSSIRTFTSTCLHALVLQSLCLILPKLTPDWKKPVFDYEEDDLFSLVNNSGFVLLGIDTEGS